MALFKRKEAVEEKGAESAAAPAAAPARPAKKAGEVSIPDVLIKPRITERASELAERNVYVFEVRSDANKQEVKKAVRALYKVEPRKVNIVNQRGKTVFSRGRHGRKRGIKKAYIYLKEGERIEVV